MSKLMDLTGQKFGRWEVIKRDMSKKGTAYWICKCECGTERSVCGSSLRSGISTSCGCYRIENSRINNGKYVDEIGNKYGKLTVIAKDEELSTIKHRAYWVCRCTCGNIITTSSKCLRDGKTLSCGCIKTSLGEENISEILTNNNIHFISQYGVIINNTRYRFDFAIINKEDQKVIRLIEFDGIQHYDTEHIHWGKTAEHTQARDKIKNKYALEHNIPLIRIPYWERDNITLELILNDKYLVKEEEYKIEIDKGEN